MHVRWSSAFQQFALFHVQVQIPKEKVMPGMRHNLRVFLGSDVVFPASLPVEAQVVWECFTDQ